MQGRWKENIFAHTTKRAFSTKEAESIFISAINHLQAYLKSETPYLKDKSKKEFYIKFGTGFPLFDWTVRDLMSPERAKWHADNYWPLPHYPHRKHHTETAHWKSVTIGRSENLLWQIEEYAPLNPDADYQQLINNSICLRAFILCLNEAELLLNHKEIQRLFNKAENLKILRFFPTMREVKEVCHMLNTLRFYEVIHSFSYQQKISAIRFEVEKCLEMNECYLPQNRMTALDPANG